MGYANGILSAPVSIRDVQQCLGNSSTDVKTLCQSTNINKWARYKPIVPPSNDRPAHITMVEMEEANFGLVAGGTFVADGSSYRLASLEWTYNRIGNSNWGRLSDFVCHSYNAKTASLIGKYGYNHNAVPPIRLNDEEITNANATMQRYYENGILRMRYNTLNDPTLSGFSIYAFYKITENLVSGSDTGNMDFTMQELGGSTNYTNTRWGLAEIEQSGSKWLWTGDAVPAVAEFSESPSTSSAGGGNLSAIYTGTWNGSTQKKPWKSFYQLLNSSFGTRKHFVPVIITKSSILPAMDSGKNYWYLNLQASEMVAFPDAKIISVEFQLSSGQVQNISYSFVTGISSINWTDNGTARQQVMCDTTGGAIAAAQEAYNSGVTDAQYMDRNFSSLSSSSANQYYRNSYVERRSSHVSDTYNMSFIIQVTANKAATLTKTDVRDKIGILQKMTSHDTGTQKSYVVGDIVPYTGHTVTKSWSNNSVALSANEVIYIVCNVSVQKTDFTAVYGGGTDNEAIWVPGRGGHYDFLVREIDFNGTLPKKYFV